MTDQDIRRSSATPDVAGVDRTLAPELLDARYSHEAGAPVGIAGGTRGEQLRHEYHAAHAEYRATSDQLAKLYEEAKPFVGELPHKKSLTDPAALHAEIGKLLRKGNLPRDASNSLQTLSFGIERHLEAARASDALKGVIALEIPHGHKDFIYGIERELIAHGGDPMRALDLAKQTFATAHAAAPKPPSALAKLMSGLRIFSKDEGDVMPPALAENGAWSVEKLEGGVQEALSGSAPVPELTEAVQAPKPTSGATGYKAAGHEGAAREAAGIPANKPYILDQTPAKLKGRVEKAERHSARAAERAVRPAPMGKLRQALHRLSVRVEGLGEPAIVPLTPPSQPPAGLVVDHKPIDFSLPMEVKRAPREIKMRARFMPQKMHSEPRFAPLSAWTGKAAEAPLAAAEEKLVLAPPKGWKPSKDVVDPFAWSKERLAERRAAVTQAREARLAAKATTPIAEVAEQVAHACESACGYNHTHTPSAASVSVTAAKSGGKGWILAGGAVVAGVAALMVSKHRSNAQTADQAPQR